MRLLNTSTLELHQFLGDCPEDYAILSHTWGEEECTFQDMSTADVTKRQGYQKIKLCCEQALKDGLKWAWVDTCCIDKKNFNELSEAINSMFRWYKQAEVCYAYLADITDQDRFAASRWFTRGWTLQELIAPSRVEFYSSDWTFMGSKSDLADTIQKTTGIDISVLATGEFRHISVAKRMSWAAKRKTTLIEDMAYSLVGIFGVVMPFIYGEGKKAFLRLQQEIMVVSDDQSLFAWGAPEVFQDMKDFVMPQSPRMRGLFADSPADFLTSHEILKVPNRKNEPPLVRYYNGAIRIEYPACTRAAHEFILIGCTTRSTARAYLGIPLKNWRDSFHARCGPLVLIPRKYWKEARIKELVVKEPQFVSSHPEAFQIVRVPNKTRPREQDQFMLDEVYCFSHSRYSESEHLIAFSPEHQGPQAAIYFTPSEAIDLKRESAIDDTCALHGFAIVLGYSDYPWTIFVPILHDTYMDADVDMDADSHLIIREPGEMAPYSMTKNQLKDILSREDMDALPPRSSRFDQLLSDWAESEDVDAFVRRRLRISVDLDIAPIDLVDDGVYVSIDIYEATMGEKVSSSYTEASMDLVYSESEEATRNQPPDWTTLDELEWFMERDSSGHSSQSTSAENSELQFDELD
ncbi:heterokaryon incompatibility protein-domain-containing protein [Xylaria nigripes]|nr:heterokaryon incompatibility protein-domain-containing protein [Xylaria nigripes]